MGSSLNLREYHARPPSNSREWAASESERSDAAVAVALENARLCTAQGDCPRCHNPCAAAGSRTHPTAVVSAADGRKDETRAVQGAPDVGALVAPTLIVAVRVCSMSTEAVLDAMTSDGQGLVLGVVRLAEGREKGTRSSRGHPC